MEKECNCPETGCDMNCMECEVPLFEPEWCEDCANAAEEAGIEYEFDVNHYNGYWECSNCRKPV